MIAKTVFVDIEHIDLSKTELDLLLFFIGNKNRVVSRSTLAEHLSLAFANFELRIRSTEIRLGRQQFAFGIARFFDAGTVRNQ